MKIVISGYIGKKITGIGRNLICLLNNTTQDHEYIIYTIYLYCTTVYPLYQTKYSERIENFMSLLYNGTGSICNTRRRYRNYD